MTYQDALKRVWDTIALPEVWEDLFLELWANFLALSFALMVLVFRAAILITFPVSVPLLALVMPK